MEVPLDFLHPVFNHIMQNGRERHGTIHRVSIAQSRAEVKGYYQTGVCNYRPGGARQLGCFVCHDGK